MIRLAAAVLTVLALSACLPDGPPKLAPVGQASVDAAKARCEATSGSFGPAPGGKGGMICFHKTRDAGKICTAGSQCEGQCLARSGTCAPVTPLMGCQEILLGGGVRMTQCIN
ncbi:hypothetical protein [Acidimangrovimonas pyrenivorans]|uniref:Lipoprotein n=1 Tax=Acidimangrovimonas pyrenivorans TaxID=2030798 RepID=A0ABV7AKA7_9RHOB